MTLRIGHVHVSSFHWLCTTYLIKCLNALLASFLCMVFYITDSYLYLGDTHTNLLLLFLHPNISKQQAFFFFMGRKSQLIIESCHWLWEKWCTWCGSGSMSSSVGECKFPYVQDKCLLFRIFFLIQFPHALFFINHKNSKRKTPT